MRHDSLARLFVLCSVLLSFSGQATAAARPDFDQRNSIAVDANAANAAKARLEAPGLRRIAAVGEMEDRFGVPTFLWAAPAEPLAAQSVTGGAPAKPTADQAARAHLARLAPFYGLGAADLAGAKLRSVHDTGRGPIIATYKQTVDGVEVFGEEVKLLMDRNLELKAASGFIASATPGKIRAAASARAFRFSSMQATANALEDFTGTAAAGAAMSHGNAMPGGFERFDVADVNAGIPAGLAPGEPVRVKKVWFHTPADLEPAYSVEILAETAADQYVISARDGRVLYRHSLMADASFTYRVWNDAAAPNMPPDGPQGSSPTPYPFATPTAYDPGFTLPTLITLQNGPIATNDPWLASGATVTNGNNVDAYADLASPDGFSGSDLRASTTSPGTFDRAYDPTLAPGVSAAQRMASVTQLFYTVNFLHDWYYAAGFDEAAGNAQVSNYGRGGIEGDGFKAEAQDYGGTNNANMTTPADGGRPRMQMYVFQAAPTALVVVNSPPAIAGTKTAARSAIGPNNFSVTAPVELYNDGVAPTSDGCGASVGSLAGKIALIDRGSCTYDTMILNAQNAGALAVIVVNNVAGPPVTISGATSPTIGAVMISQSDGADIKAQLGGGVNVTVSSTPNLQRDGSIDNQIVAHEYGHYVNNRLIGNGSGLGGLQAGGMGEGWGDFQGQLLTVRAEDALVSPFDFSGTYSTGGYALSPSVAPSTTYYFGVRRYPYSTDFAKNALTFRHIQDGEPLPVGPPAKVKSSPNSEVHNAGEVWATMLWECYAALLRDTGRLSFVQSQTRMRDYLVAAYKMTPLDPTFTEARDALLSVVLASDPLDHAAFCAAFARRGAGVGAISPPRTSTTNIGVVESYVCGGALDFVSATITDDVRSCDNDGILDNGESGTLMITLRNSGSTALSATTATVTSPNPSVNFPYGHTVAMSNSSPYGTSTGSLVIGMFGAVGVEPLDLQIAYTDPALIATPVNGVLVANGNADLTPSTTETVDQPSAGWSYTGNPHVAANGWARATLGSNFVFSAPDPGGLSDEYLITPPLNVAASGAFTFSFKQAYSYETSGGIFWDGGVIEITDNAGASWTDIGASASPTYGGTLYVGAGNPLSGRSAYVGQSTGFPALATVNVNLGTTYAGKTVRVRFRIGADEASGGAGWQVDDLVVNNITNQPFNALIGDPTVCAPVAVGDVLPTEWSLALAGSNPSRGMPTLRFALPSAGHVTIALYDVAGRKVTTLAEGEFAAGYHTTAWNTESGDIRPRAGVYFARMVANRREFVQRVVLLQ